MPSAKLDALAHTYNLGTQEAEGEMDRQTETDRQRHRESAILGLPLV